MLDHEIIGKFKEFQEKTGKYSDLKIEDVEFEKVDIFNDTENIKLIGSKKIGSHDELENIYDSDGIPVYDASANILTYVKENKYPEQVFTVEDNNNPDISFASEGNSSAGTNFIIHKDSYFINNHRTVIKFSNKYYSKYIYYNIKDMKKKYGFKRGYIPSQTELRRLQILIPIPKDLNEKYTSYKLQEIIVEFLEWGFAEADKIKENIDKRADILKRAKKCLIPSVFKKDYVKETFGKYAKENGLDYNITDVEFEQKSIINYINMKRGKVIAKKDLEPNGKYPVYSSQTKDEGLFGYLNDYMHDGESITWTTDGKHAGTTFLRKGKFNYTNVCGLITVKESNLIEIRYLFYLTKLLFFKYVDRTSQNSKLMTHHINKIFIFVPKPLKNYTSLEIQKHIADFIDHYMNIIAKEEDRVNKAYDAVERLKKVYLNRTFRLINWEKNNE